ncbi:MAG TPA: cytochrome c-type biogenesis protein CcmH [Candidatus Limnocylindria bacterium]|nr:cytochrome c-type biogenesis protein CcmH [Candidatus Limnocylindria bacterium]
MTHRLVLALALVVVGAAALAAARPADATPEARVERIASELRCPVCQGQPVSDSPSQTAREMRQLVAERVAEGRTDDEIRAEFRASYGDWILLTPEAGGPGAVVWLTPLLATALGMAVALALIRARRARTAAP